MFLALGITGAALHAVGDKNNSVYTALKGLVDEDMTWEELSEILNELEKRSKDFDSMYNCGLYEEETDDFEDSLDDLEFDGSNLDKEEL